MNLFLQFIKARNFSQCRKLTWGYWSLIIVFIMLIYLLRPIYSLNTIVRIGGLAVVFLGSIFLKTLNMHSRVKSLLKPLYLLTSRSFDIFYFQLHTLFVVSTTSCCRAQNNGNSYTNHSPVYMKKKLSHVERSPSRPSQLYLAFVWQKSCPVWPSQRLAISVWIETDFYIPSSIQ